MKKTKFIKMICLMLSLVMIFSMSAFAVDESSIPAVFEAVEHDHDSECVDIHSTDLNATKGELEIRPYGLICDITGHDFPLKIGYRNVNRGPDSQYCSSYVKEGYTYCGYCNTETYKWVEQVISSVSHNMVRQDYPNPPGSFYYQCSKCWYRSGIYSPYMHTIES